MEQYPFEIEGNTHNTWKFLLFHLSPLQNLLPATLEQSVSQAVSSGAGLVNIGSGCLRARGKWFLL